MVIKIGSGSEAGDGFYKVTKIIDSTTLEVDSVGAVVAPYRKKARRKKSQVRRKNAPYKDIE